MNAGKYMAFRAMYFFYYVGVDELIIGARIVLECLSAGRITTRKYTLDGTHLS